MARRFACLRVSCGRTGPGRHERRKRQAVATPAVAHRARLGARAFGPDLQKTRLVDPGNGAAARADGITPAVVSTQLFFVAVKSKVGPALVMYGRTILSAWLT